MLIVSRVICALAVAGSISACGGGGGSGAPRPSSSVIGNGLASSTGPGDTDSYVPTMQGDHWSFNYVTDDPGALVTSANVKITVNGTKSIHGVTGTVFTRSDPTLSSGGYDQYFYVSAGGLSLLGNSDTGDSITPLIVPYVELLFPVQVGPVSTVTRTNLPFGHDSSGRDVTLNLTQSINNEAIESVDVPAGTFSNALRQLTTVSATALDSGQSSPAAAGTDASWYVPGVGQIKEQTSVKGNGSTVTGSAELRGYTVNGKSHGLGATTTLVPTLQTASQIVRCGNPERQTMATDGNNFLVVAHQCDVSSGTQSFKWTATLAGPDGTPTASVDLSPPTAPYSPGMHAVAAFDGTNYLVVYEAELSSAGMRPNLDAVLVSASGAIISGPNVVGVSADLPNFGGEAQALVFGGGHYLLIYNDANSYLGPLSGIFLSPATGQAEGAAFPIFSQNDGDHAEPAVGFDGTNFLAVWNETLANPAGLYAVRISNTGNVVDSSPLLVMDNTAADRSGSCCDLQDLEPNVSYDGSNYLVAYRDTRGAHRNGGQANFSAARVPTAGVLLDGSSSTPGIAVTSSNALAIGRLRSVFFQGAHWLVWETGYSVALQASRVSPAGVVPTV